MNRATTINQPDFYIAIIRSIYDRLLIHPEKIQIECGKQGPAQIDFLAQGHATDQGLMIGTAGNNIRALQKILEYVGRRAGMKIRLKILEAYTGTKQVQNRPPFDPEWEAQDKHQPFAELLTDISAAIYGVPLEVMSGHKLIKEEPSTEFTLDVREMPLDLKDALNTIFHAIGRAHGRNIVVKTRSEETDEDRASGTEARQVLG